MAGEFDFYKQGTNPSYNWQYNWGVSNTPSTGTVNEDLIAGYLTKYVNDNTKTKSGIGNFDFSLGKSAKGWVDNYINKYGSDKYNLLNAGILAGTDLVGNLINSNGLSTTAGNIMTGIGNIVGNIPGPVGWAGKGLALLGQGVNALRGHKFNDANVAAAEKAVTDRSNWQFGDYSNTASLLAGSLANKQLGNVSKDYLGKEGPFSHAVTDKMNEINNATLNANARANNSELLAYANYQNNLVRNAISNDGMGNVNMTANGGPLNMISGPMTPFGNRFFANGGFTHGGLFTNGFIEVNNGGSHEQNPNQGVQYGVDPQGTPNMVEEGETILDDYVFSRRIKFPKRYKDEFALGGKIWKKSFADVSKMIAKESEERPNDPISQRSLKAMGGKLADIQEEVKAKQALDKMDPREVMAMLQQLAMLQQGGEQPQMTEDPYQQQMMAEEQPIMAANGGGIYIKPSKRGTFTAEASKHGKSVQDFASQVLSNPDNYSSAMVKKANFARNAAKWHACGGLLKRFDNGGKVNLFTPGGLAYILNGDGSIDLDETPEGREYLASKVRRNLVAPYNYGVDANNVNITPEYIPINGKSTWADFVDSNNVPLYNIDTQKYTDSYLNPKFLEWAWDNVDNEYLNNKSNFANWYKQHKNAPTNADIFGSRGKTNGLGFDKKLSDLHWYLQHMYNRYIQSLNNNNADTSVKPNTETGKDTSGNPTQTPAATTTGPQLTDRELRKARLGYTEDGIRYFVDEVDANGTPTRKEIEYDPGTFAELYPGYRFSKEDEKLYDDENKKYTRQFVYTKGTEPLKYHELPTGFRYLTPIFQGIYAGLGQAKLINNPDYQFANALMSSASNNNGYTPVRYNPVSNPHVFNPLNLDYYSVNADNSAMGQLRILQNVLGNNIGALTANNAAIINNANRLKFEGLRSLLESDTNRRKEYGTLSSGIAQANSAGSLDAQKANQTAYSNWLRQNNDIFGRGIEYRYRAKKDSDEANSTNMSGFLESMSNIDNENINWNWRNWAIANGVFGPMKTVPYGYGIG